jgi:hypothetical protein
MADHWLAKAGRRWFGLVVGIVSAAGVVGFATTARLYWAWLAIAALALLALSFALTAREEHNRRVAGEAHPHQPPGGGDPIISPVDYQVAALRQVLARISETTLSLDWRTLDGVLQNLPRSGADPLYEPLRVSRCAEGIAQLVALGELVELGTNDVWAIRQP